MKSKSKEKYEVHIIIGAVLLFMIALVLLSITIVDLIIKNPIENRSDFDFTIIVLPDTQTYSQKYPEIFENQTRWISSEKEDLNVRFVIHLGDIVNSNIEKEWQVANQSIAILEDSNIPFSLVPGNHDYTLKDYSNFNTFFPVQRFQNKAWFGGNYDNYKNNYELLNLSNLSILFINLDYCPDKEEINWANQIADKYPDHFTILTTHGFLNANDPPLRQIHLCGSTEYIWDDLVKNHKNMRLVLSGHVHTEKRRVDNNIYGLPVYQMVSDYQSEDNGKSGYLRILEFDLKNRKINVRTYSPYLNNYKTGYESEFSLDI